MNQKYADRSKYIPWIFIPTLMALAIQTAISIFGLELYIVKALGETKDSNYTDFYVGVVKDFTQGNATAALMIGYAVITAIIGIWIFYNYFRDRKFSSLKGKSKSVPFTVVGLILFVVGMQYVTLYLLNALASAFPSWLEEYNQLMETAGIDSDMTVLLFVIVCTQKESLKKLTNDIVSAASDYVREYHLEHLPVRFDRLIITGTNDNDVITHEENVLPTIDSYSFYEEFRNKQQVIEKLN